MGLPNDPEEKKPEHPAAPEDKPPKTITPKTIKEELKEARAAKDFLRLGALEIKSFNPIKPGKPSQRDQETQGNYNTFRRQEHPVRYQQVNPQTGDSVTDQKEAKVAVLTLKFKKDVTENDRAMTLLGKKIAEEKREEREKKEKELKDLQDLELSLEEQKTYEEEKRRERSQKQTTSFIARFLSRGRGGKVSELAVSDLFTWLDNENNARTITQDEIKSIVAQMVLAVYRLHVLFGMVHRDIKNENILIFLTPKGPRIKLSDLDTTREQNDPNMPFYDVGTRQFFPPEYKKKVGEKTALDPWAADAAKKMPVDCYALGKTIDEIANKVINKSSPFWWQLRSLVIRLNDQNPETRYTIEQAMDDPFFGTTSEEREQYFNLVRESCEDDDLYLGGWYVDPSQDFYPQDNNSFLMLSPLLQEIYIQAESLRQQMILVHDHADKLRGSDLMAIMLKIEHLNHLITLCRNPNKNLKRGVDQAKKKLDKLFLERITQQEIADIFHRQIRNENPKEKNCFDFLYHQQPKEKEEYYHRAIQHLDDCIRDENKKEEKDKDEGVITLLTTYKETIEKEKQKMPSKGLPYLTESIYRFAHKVKYRNDPAFYYGKGRNNINESRGLALSKTVYEFEWGRLVGGIGMLIFGGILVTGAVVALVTSFGSAAPLSAVLGAIGVHIAASVIESVIIGSASVVGAYGLKTGLKGLYTTFTAEKSATIKKDTQLEQKWNEATSIKNKQGQ